MENNCYEKTFYKKKKIGEEVMNIEKEIFQKTKIDFSKLIPFGFKKEKDFYIYKTNILKDTFKVEITITMDELVIGKIYELEFNEEYTNYRSPIHTGQFVNKIRTEFIKILTDIKDKCTIKMYFISPQANRITNFIYQKYKDNPEFMWEKSPGHGVFRNKENQKWYAIIMKIKKQKLTGLNQEEDIEVINLKLDEEKIKNLLKNPGFYKAYHMNKKSWLSIILDDTVSDELINSLLMESHANISNKKNKII